VLFRGGRRAALLARRLALSTPLIEICVALNGDVISICVDCWGGIISAMFAVVVNVNDRQIFVSQRRRLQQQYERNQQVVGDQGQYVSASSEVERV
jgi:hypothetical protein